MFNILPQEQKKEIQKEYHSRRLVVIVYLLITTMVIGIVLLFPTYLNSQINNKNIADELDFVGQEIKKSTANVSTPEDIVSLKEKITILNSSKDTSTVYVLFSNIIDAKGPNIKLKNFSYKKGDAELEDTIVLEGNAKTRDSLTSFTHSLEAQTQFSNVDLPISNLVKDKDIDFTLTITARSKK